MLVFARRILKDKGCHLVNVLKLMHTWMMSQVRNLKRPLDESKELKIKSLKWPLQIWDLNLWQGQEITSLFLHKVT